MTEVLVVILGEPSAALHEATQPDGPLANGRGLTLWHAPYEAQTVSDIAELPTFRLAWIFADGSALDSHILRAWQHLLRHVAPVTIAVYQRHGDPQQLPANLNFRGGVILQPYTDASFCLVLTLITDFITKNSANGAHRNVRDLLINDPCG